MFNVIADEELVTATGGSLGASAGGGLRDIQWPRPSPSPWPSPWPSPLPSPSPSPLPSPLPFPSPWPKLPTPYMPQHPQQWL